MCGIFGLASVRGRRPSLDDGRVAALRDRLAHRGPDGAGLWRGGSVVLAHRRLAVVDLSEAAAQPMATPDGACVIAYNGEVYNDAALRADLAGAPAPPAPPAWRSRSDTETLLHLLAREGAAALRRVRGMYALAFFDARAQRLVLARDPLGIKPLYYAWCRVAGAPELVFASEIPAILGHPGVPRRPDPAGVSAYLSTIRTVIGDRTLFAGVQAVRPGEVIELDLSGGEVREARATVGLPDAAPPDTRRIVADSVRAHLRSDAPLCCMLSGGLDSTIIAAVAREHHPDLRTYCAGTPGRDEGDLEEARLVAGAWGLKHTEAPVTRALFEERWPEMIRRAGLPLSTPNEVAINEVARRMRAAGEVVTLSGEGADELFGGYDRVLGDAVAFEGGGARGAPDRARHVLESAAWVPLSAKAGVLAPSLWRALDGDALLIDALAGEFSNGAAHDALGVHLRYLRRVNLTGLLARLDSATMLESIEGRTPFADAHVAALAEALPSGEKFAPAAAGWATKIALRRAFAADVPARVLGRPKASFPLPFRGWLGAHAPALRRSRFAAEFFTPQAVDLVLADPAASWSLAWPMINLALWWE